MRSSVSLSMQVRASSFLSWWFSVCRERKASLNCYFSFCSWWTTLSYFYATSLWYFYALSVCSYRLLFKDQG